MSCQIIVLFEYSKADVTVPDYHLFVLCKVLQFNCLLFVCSVISTVLSVKGARL